MLFKMAQTKVGELENAVMSSRSTSLHKDVGRVHVLVPTKHMSAGLAQICKYLPK